MRCIVNTAARSSIPPTKWATVLARPLPSSVSRPSITSICAIICPSHSPTAPPSCLCPLELIDRIAASVPPPQGHRHRYHGVLAPNSPLRDQVTALVRKVAADATRDAQASDADQTDADERVLRSPARYLWATLIARLFEQFPLTCRYCGADMKIIAFVIETPSVRAILEHIGEPARPPVISSARPCAALPAPLGHQPKPSWFGRSLLQRSSPTVLGGRSDPGRSRRRSTRPTRTGDRIRPTHSVVTAVAVAARSAAQSTPARFPSR